MKKLLNNEKILGILAIIIYFILLLVIPLYFNFNLSETASIIFNIFYQILTIAITMLILNKQITKSFKDFKKNHLKYFKENFKYYLIGISVMFISNAIIILVLNKGVAANEEVIRSLISTNPIYTYILAVFFAPVIEELIFRQSFRYAIKNDYVFIITSGLVFGLLHILTDFSGPSDLLYIIPYSALGISFAFILTRCKNIFTTMGIHMMHNGILISLQIMILLFS